MKFLIKHIEYQEKETQNKILGMLIFLRKTYPNFRDWYLERVLPGLRSGTRGLYVAYADEEEAEIAGILILKNECAEKKICTLCVFPKFQGWGLGKQFVELALRELKDEKPLVTVPESYRNEYAGLFAKFGFVMYKEYVGYYRPDQSEYAYNGYLIDCNERLLQNA